jgi:threonine/homoserine/homoserine lactone efflux protein
MGLIEIVPLVLIMAVGAFIPSSSVALVVARSLTHGIPNGISVSMGIVAGDAIFILLVVFGLSVVAESMGWLFLTIKYIGATYLIWLGCTLLLSKSTAIEIEKKATKGDFATSFFAGLFLTLGDVKAIFFFISLFPAFISLKELSLTDIAIVLLIDVIVVGGIKIFYAFSATKVASISARHGLDNKIKKVAGGFMISAGSYIIVKA